MPRHRRFASGPMVTRTAPVIPPSSHAHMRHVMWWTPSSATRTAGRLLTRFAATVATHATPNIANGPPCPYPPERGVAPAGSGLDEALKERERGIADFAPPMVDRERVAPPGHLDDLGDAVVLALALVRRVRDRPRHGVVELARDDEQRPAVGVLRLHLDLGPRIEVCRCRLEQRGTRG